MGKENRFHVPDDGRYTTPGTAVVELLCEAMGNATRRVDGFIGSADDSSYIASLRRRRVEGILRTLIYEGITDEMLDAGLNTGLCNDAAEARELFVAMIKAALGDRE